MDQLLLPYIFYSSGMRGFFFFFFFFGFWFLPVLTPYGTHIKGYTHGQITLTL